MPAKKTAALKAKPAPKVVKKTVVKPKAKANVMKKNSTNDSCCGRGDDCCSKGKDKDDSCCKDGDSCCSGAGKNTSFLATILVVLILVVVSYFAYDNYQKDHNANFKYDDDNGVTTVTPGPGLAPDGPPAVIPPTVPPPTT